MKLGDILVKDSRATRDNVEEALRERHEGERIGQTLIRLGTTSEEDVYRALADQARMEYVDLTDVEVDTTIPGTAGVKTVFRRKVLPLARNNGTVRVAISDPLDLEVLDDLRVILKSSIEPVLARPTEVDRLIKRHFGVAADEVHRMVDAARAEATPEAAVDEATLAEDAASIKLRAQRSPNDAFHTVRSGPFWEVKNHLR